MTQSILPPWIEQSYRQLCLRSDSKTLPHALLVAGEVGLGKRAFVEMLARYLLCLSPIKSQHDLIPQACGTCRSCIWLDAASHPDFFRMSIEAEASQIKIQQIRSLCDRLNMRANSGAYQVAIIDPADNMTIESYNALLKTLEEPTEGSVIFLLADQVIRLPATIRSRCQTISMPMPNTRQAHAWLQASRLENADIDLALLIAGGNPGGAKTMIERGGGQFLRQAAIDLAAIATQKKSSIQIAAQWAQSENLSQQLGWLIRVIQLSLCAQSNLSVLIAFKDLTKDADFNKLSTWWDQANRLREQLRAPLRHDLALTELLRNFIQLIGNKRAA